MAASEVDEVEVVCEPSMYISCCVIRIEDFEPSNAACASWMAGISRGTVSGAGRGLYLPCPVDLAHSVSCGMDGDEYI